MWERFVARSGMIMRNSLIAMQAGATLVLGAALMSVLFPIKFGFFGLLMILYALVKAGIMPFIPGLVFIPVFAVATDIGSMFRRNPRAVAARGIPPAEDRVKQS